jgi:hypothetical protein
MAMVGQCCCYVDTLTRSFYICVYCRQEIRRMVDAQKLVPMGGSHEQRTGPDSPLNG